MQDVITLDMDTPPVQYLCRKDKRLAKVMSMVGAISYTPHKNGYSFLVHEIIEQMLSVKAGQKIYARLEALCDGDISPNRIALLSDDEIRSIGTSQSKVSYIRNITNATIEGELNLDELAQKADADVMSMLENTRHWELDGEDVSDFRSEPPGCSPNGGCGFSARLPLGI